MTLAGKSRGHDCRVLEISRDGAKLLADVVAPTGTIIHLSADENDPDRKECEVIWQKNRMLGVKFV